MGGGGGSVRLRVLLTESGATALTTGRISFFLFDAVYVVCHTKIHVLPKCLLQPHTQSLCSTVGPVALLADLQKSPHTTDTHSYWWLMDQGFVIVQRDLSIVCECSGWRQSPLQMLFGVRASWIVIGQQAQTAKRPEKNNTARLNSRSRPHTAASGTHRYRYVTLDVNQTQNDTQLQIFI